MREGHHVPRASRVELTEKVQGTAPAMSTAPSVTRPSGRAPLRRVGRSPRNLLVGVQGLLLGAGAQSQRTQGYDPDQPMVVVNDRKPTQLARGHDLHRLIKEGLRTGTDRLGRRELADHGEGRISPF